MFFLDRMEIVIVYYRIDFVLFYCCLYRISLRCFKLKFNEVLEQCLKMHWDCFQGDLGEGGFVTVGIPGDEGFPGQDGRPGEIGFAGRPGARGIDGFPGTRGFKGPSGEDGLEGPPGENGQRRPKGEHVSVTKRVHVVQLLDHLFCETAAICLRTKL